MKAAGAGAASVARATCVAIKRRTGVARKKYTRRSPALPRRAQTWREAEHPRPRRDGRDSTSHPSGREHPSPSVAREDKTPCNIRQGTSQFHCSRESGYKHQNQGRLDPRPQRLSSGRPRNSRVREDLGWYRSRRPRAAAAGRPYLGWYTIAGDDCLVLSTVPWTVRWEAAPRVILGENRPQVQFSATVSPIRRAISPDGTKYCSRK